MLEILNVKKSYKIGEKVLKGISLCVQEGDLFAFIGHNGAGKSTLIKCIAGILNFESGQIRVFGKDISKQSLEAKQCMAYVPDNPDIYRGQVCLRPPGAEVRATCLCSDNSGDDCQLCSSR